MDTLLRFGSGNQVYTFTPDYQIMLKDNFRNLVPNTTRLPGLDGGLDEYGTNPAPSEIGNVQVMFWLFATSNTEMTAKKRALGALSSWGVKRLYKQPLDTSQTEVYCDARVNSIDYGETSRDQPHLRQRVQLNFQVANPSWYGRGTESAAWGDGSTWGSGVIWGGTAVANACTGLQNDFSLNVGGNSLTYPRIEVRCGGAQTASGIVISRIVQNVIVDQVTYNQTLVANDSLIINCRASSVRKNSIDAYGNHFTYLKSGWFRLEAGANAIRVGFTNVSDAASVYFRYYDAWK